MTLKKANRCPKCDSAQTKKNGRFRGVQRYKCEQCGKQFQSSRRPKHTIKTLWREWAFEHATTHVLATRYERSEDWVRARLDQYELPMQILTPRNIALIIDASKIGLSWVIVARDPHGKENVYVKEISWESTSSYQEAVRYLQEKGFTITAIVGDGRVAVPWLFKDIPTQMCHFHQLQIVIRYLTRNPKLPASIELLEIAKTLATTDKDSFTDAFNLWSRQWDSFLKERSEDPETGKKRYTHRRLRSARDSIRQHLPHLFVFTDYPELNIPNTTNSLDGSFTAIKKAIGIHAGLSHQRKLKLVRSLLLGFV